MFGHMISSVLIDYSICAIAVYSSESSSVSTFFCQQRLPHFGHLIYLSLPLCGAKITLCLCIIFIIFDISHYFKSSSAPQHFSAP
ncbi:hypothetical protein GCWU000342_00284 [Shuttleworthella satelles DSM 14600]|uniref:Uncharacterized protein n=1 Tax=Shuttleworthella satelles DSM 14600 TaxID=626523 RepID=C4G8I9_9FIRM|nr:hypothetical protein GCWU000342_00284 [Shuttleworthia satelles DSM 14600]